MARTSIYVEGFGHKNPIPAACRVGSLLLSSSIQGTDPSTGKYGATLEAQCALMFAHIRRILAAAKASPDDIVKVTIWMRDRTKRQALNGPWLEMFPDPQSRPARHTMDAALDGEKQIECVFEAVMER